jgi:hypothetical protein
VHSQKFTQGWRSVARDLPPHKGLLPAHLIARRAMLYDPHAGLVISDY